MSADFQSTNAFIRAWSVELLCAAAFVVVVPILAAYIGWLEQRFASAPAIGPDAAAPRAILSPIVDALASVGEKDAACPTGLNGMVTRVAPLFVFATAMMALAAIAVGPGFWIARDSNAGILFVVSVASLGLLGSFVGRWAAQDVDIQNVVRSAVQIAGFGIVAGFATVSALLLAGTLRAGEVVEAQRRFGAWFVFLAPAAFVLYFIATMMATDRAPFNRKRADDAGGFRHWLYRFADYVNVILISAVGTTLFFGGWLRPFANVHWMHWIDTVPAVIAGALAVFAMVRAGKHTVRASAIQLWIAAAVGVALAVVLALSVFHEPLQFLQAGLLGVFWFWLKTLIYVMVFVWLRTSLPRFRFEQLMQLCWSLLLPFAVATVVATGAAMLLEMERGWNRWLTFGFADVALLGAAIVQIALREKVAVGKVIPAVKPAPLPADTGAHAG